MDDSAAAAAASVRPEAHGSTTEDTRHSKYDRVSIRPHTRIWHAAFHGESVFLQRLAVDGCRVTGGY